MSEHCPACGEVMTPENSVPAPQPRKYATRVCADEDACRRRHHARYTILHPGGWKP